MNDQALKELWKTSNEKIAINSAFLAQQAEEIVHFKVHHVIHSMKPIKLFTLVFGVIWVLGGGVILANLAMYAYAQVSPFFLYSAILQVLITAIAVAIHIFQIINIYSIDITKTILDTQERIAALRSSTLLEARIMLLQLPLWITMFLSIKTLQEGNIAYIVVNLVLLLMALYASFWAFKNVRLENSDKKWFRMAFSGKEWQPIVHSLEMLKKVNSYGMNN